MKYFLRQLPARFELRYAIAGDESQLHPEAIGYTPNHPVKCFEAAISNNIGKESQALARDARKATRASFADSGGIAAPFSALSAVHEMMRF